MFESIISFFKKLGKNEKESSKSKDAAKERLHLVLMQDRANISADFLALMKQEIIEVIKRYIDVDENAIDVRLTNKANDDGTTGAPVLYANIPILSVKEEAKKVKTAENDNDVVNDESIDEVENNNENMEKDENKEESKNQTEVDKEIEQNKENNDKQEVELNELGNINKEEKEKSEEEKEKENQELQEVIQKAEEIVEEDNKI